MLQKSTKFLYYVSKNHTNIILDLNHSTHFLFTSSSIDVNQNLKPKYPKSEIYRDEGANTWINSNFYLVLINLSPQD